MGTEAVKNVIIWGNHSSTQFPDVAHAVVNKDSKAVGVYEAVNNDTWLKEEFVKVLCMFFINVLLLKYKVVLVWLGLASCWSAPVMTCACSSCEHASLILAINLLSGKE